MGCVGYFELKTKRNHDHKTSMCATVSSPILFAVGLSGGKPKGSQSFWTPWRKQQIPQIRFSK